jgi:hypothetical protein
MENIYWKRSQYSRFWRTCLLRGFTFTFIVRIIISVFVPGRSRVVQKLESGFVPYVTVLVQKLNNNSHNKCKSKSPKKTRLLKSVVSRRKFLVFHHLLLSLTQI